MVRWIEVKSGHTISWSIQPHKKGINFGIFQHPGSGIAPTPKLPSATFEVPPTPTTKPNDAAAESSTSQATGSAAVQKLQGIGLKLVFWQGHCDANIVTTGTFDVLKGEGGMYALLFDNTFAKQYSKTATLVLRTYSTDSAPQIAHHIQTNAAGSSQSLKIKPIKSRPKLQADQTSSDSVPTALPSTTEPARELDSLQSSSVTLNGGNFFTGVLQKRRRKRGQGYARRFFSLDFTTSTLSYYHDRNSLIIRGAVPLSLAAIATNPSTREISIDSGAEVWHLKTINKKDFETWQNALDFASKPYIHNSSTASPRPDGRISRIQSAFRPNPEEEREWGKIEGLVSKICASRDLARGLARDTDPKYLPSPALHRDNPAASNGELSQYPSSTDLSPAEFGPNEEYFNQPQERKSFWKRKASATRSITKRSVSAQGISPGLPALPNGSHGPTERSPSLPRARVLPDESLHERCMKLLQELDSVVNQFSTLVSESKERRTPLQSMAASRMSLDSIGSQEFFDAEAGDSQLLTINRESDDEAPLAREVEYGLGDQDDSSASDLEDRVTSDLNRSSLLASSSLQEANPAFAPRVKPLDLHSSLPAERRLTVPAPTALPPSLIGFLRKNVGKDLSTISMPVSANEPISLLQKSAEMLEYSQLLDAAAKGFASQDDEASTLRLLHVTAFAISMLSEFRVKERAIRKPFNPMLGETYELIRGDRGFRFFAEKISHRPVRLACQADGENWSLTQSPLPSQKFWGKSAELITEGKVRVSLFGQGDGGKSDEHYSWTSPTCFLRNLIAGEKYIEPVGSLTVTCESTGAYSLTTFKSKGMFGGRSEEVVVQSFDAMGEELSLGLVGRWTESLSLTRDGTTAKSSQAPIWKVGSLVPDAARCYGFPSFAATLNETTSVEKGLLPCTDSRLRSDQRLVEEGDVERAEGIKGRLEEKQRDRRKQLEEDGREYEPVWFSRVEAEKTGGAEECWRLKSGKEGYWETRGREGGWKGRTEIVRVFDV